ncbi:penicillin acylase family protein [Tunturiibacter empetritectus]|uniref:Acyl-homoserine lactone acylase PvdQ n=2 Tax=Tunturiibacter TaxID=3154218 RepID=A0A852VDX3_9BACT|nr:penicillin acylase family protein [Edaphobacter lichenicola]NYF91073.1 acyl-homoserine lactone acylase PvdQ [Edaphobacter lichenicola]
MQNRSCFNPLVILIAILFSSTALRAIQNEEQTRWKQEAANVTITRDYWGIAHIHGKTDADTVFGMEYAQAEDDFNRIEINYINAMGRLAETEGESRIYQDLRMKLFINPIALKKQYADSPAWLHALMDAFADGLNFYLYQHPEVKPRVIHHFEPWMALSFTEGSIGGDIERIDLPQLEAFYSHPPPVAPAVGSHLSSEPQIQSSRPDAAHLAAVVERHPHFIFTANLPYIHDSDPPEPTGSNGMAIAPSNTANHHALLLINPHTSLFFRSELQMTSDEDLDAYGAVTWGQFFIYQGFNQRAGWMHTSSGVDAVDEYLETVEKKGDHFTYRYGNQQRPITAEQITIPYKTDHGMAEMKFTIYRTHHGPVIREESGKWVSIRLMQEPIKALTQSYLRTKATSYKAFRQTLELKANSSNNTIFADADGDIAYFHGNFIPRRDPAFDFTKPVDGSNPATDWKGLLTVDEIPQLLNPGSGWLYNSNNSPWSGAGASSLRKQDYPAYVETGTETARGLHAIRVLENKKDFTLDSLIAAAYDSYLPWFDKPLPALLKAWDEAPRSNLLRAKLTEQIATLRPWNHRWAVDSIPTSLAVFWGEDIRRHTLADAKAAGISVEDFIATRVSSAQLLQSLSNATDRLTADFGTWKTPWGDINRFQRLAGNGVATGKIAQPFDDTQPSIPVPFTSSLWGSLASFGARPYPGTKKWYGTSGNSFVAVVEFGDKVHAKAVTAGGESGDPTSPHFNDQATRYSTGNLRDVYFYPSDLKDHIARQYHPGSQEPGN